MERSVRNIVLAVFVGLSASAFAQSEGGLLLGVEAEKKIDKKLSVSVEAEMRTRNDFKTMDRWKFGISGSYKFTKWLKADVGYDLLNDNNREKKEYYTSSSGKYVKIHWRPGYWGVKHRFHASLTGSVKIADFKLSLRERWQYSYRPEKDVTRWTWRVSDAAGNAVSDTDMRLDDDYSRSAKGKNQLRSRLEIAYDKKRALFSPYASMELYNSWAIEKIRYTVGTGIRLSKQHSLDVFYRFENMRNVDADEYDPDMHYLGIGYKFKF